MTVNVNSRSDDWRAQQLSNFAEGLFEIDGVWFYSVEGFIQALKFPEDHPNKAYGGVLTGSDAKKLGESAEKKYIWWKGQRFDYGSEAHHYLIARAIAAKFYQNTEKMSALLATGDEVITHDLGEPEEADTSLPAELFCKILMEIRKEARSFYQNIPE